MYASGGRTPQLPPKTDEALLEACCCKAVQELELVLANLPRNLMVV